MNVSRLLPLNPAPPIERKAEAIAELKEIYASYEEAVERTKQDERIIQRLQDRLQMLEEDLRGERERARICERKLIRLAANQRNISRIAQDGDEIMRSVQEWQEAETELPAVEEISSILDRSRQDEQEQRLPENNL